MILTQWSRSVGGAFTCYCCANVLYIFEQPLMNINLCLSYSCGYVSLKTTVQIKTCINYIRRRQKNIKIIFQLLKSIHITHTYRQAHDRKSSRGGQEHCKNFVFRISTIFQFSEVCYRYIIYNVVLVFY